MTPTPADAAPRLRSILWRLLWVSAVGGLLLALGLALAGTGVVGGGGELVADLIPAVVLIGLGMAIPPALGAVLAIAVVGRPPRTPRREQWAAVVGGVVGAFISPVLFYTGWALLGVALALAIAVVAGVGYPLVVRSLWSRGATSP